jgi:hypothetical protein
MAHMHLGTHGLKERNLDRAATSNAPEHTAGSKAAEENPKPSETH